jgi:hypothetical protein
MAENGWALTRSSCPHRLFCHCQEPGANSQEPDNDWGALLCCWRLVALPVLSLCFMFFVSGWRLVAGKVRSAIELLYQGTVLLQCLGVLNQGAQAAEDKKCHCLSRSELWCFPLATKLIPPPDPACCGRTDPWQRHRTTNLWGNCAWPRHFAVRLSRRRRRVMVLPFGD